MANIFALISKLRSMISL